MKDKKEGELIKKYRPNYYQSESIIKLSLIYFEVKDIKVFTNYYANNPNGTFACKHA
jgi:hypothetical protein